MFCTTSEKRCVIKRYASFKAKQARRKQQTKAWKKLQQQKEQERRQKEEEQRKQEEEEERRKREEEIRKIRDLSNQEEQYNRFMKLVGGKRSSRSKVSVQAGIRHKLLSWINAVFLKYGRVKYSYRTEVHTCFLMCFVILRTRSSGRVRLGWKSFIPAVGLLAVPGQGAIFQPLFPICKLKSLTYLTWWLRLIVKCLA